MIVKYDIKLPSYRGEIVKEYLKTLELDKRYDAWTVEENLEVVPCIGLVKNNGSWHYHHNYDDSENELAIFTDRGHYLAKWFTLDKEEAIAVQQENIKEWEKILKAELKQLKKLCDKKN